MTIFVRANAKILLHTNNSTRQLPASNVSKTRNYLANQERTSTRHEHSTKRTKSRQPTEEKRASPVGSAIYIVTDLGKEGVSINSKTERDSAKIFRRKRCAKDLGVQWNWNEVNRTTNKSY